MKPLPNAHQRYKARHIRLGLCVQCSRRAAKGLLRCRVCQEMARKRRMERHPLFCLECRKLIRPEERRRGNRFHKRCAEKRRATKYPLQHRATALAYQKRHRELGLCHSCSERVFKWGYCGKHHKMGQDRYYDRAVSRSISRQQASVTKVKPRSS